jgi:hypothetical protein
MKPLTWWLRIVGVLYLLEGGGLTLMALFAADQFAATWASAPVGSLDDIAVRGIRVAGLPGVLTWVLLGVMMLIFSRVPARASLLVVTVAAWELLVWLPADLVGIFSGFATARAISLITFHVVVGVSGLLLLRRSRTAAAQA